MSEITHTFDFEESKNLAALFGANDRHLAQIEEALDVHLAPRGTTIAVKGKGEATAPGKVARPTRSRAKARPRRRARRPGLRDQGQRLGDGAGQGCPAYAARGRGRYPSASGPGMHSTARSTWLHGRPSASSTETCSVYAPG